MEKIKRGVTFITGTMFSQKSRLLIDFINQAHKDENTKYLVFKPTKDTRDGLYVKSRVYEQTVKALAWDQEYKDMDSIFEYTVMGLSLTNPDERKIIFFDEIHFLCKDDVEFIYDTCVKYGVDLVLAGLETSFKLEPFESTSFINTVVDCKYFLYGKCYYSGKNEAEYNILLENGRPVFDGSELRPGNEEYVVVSPEYKDKLLKGEKVVPFSSIKDLGEE